MIKLIKILVVIGINIVKFSFLINISPGSLPKKLNLTPSDIIKPIIIKNMPITINNLPIIFTYKI